jgi:hypothetical protein
MNETASTDCGNIIFMDKQNRINGIYIPLKVGDIIYTGRFKNKKTTVKTIGVDEYGIPTINGKRAFTFRILPTTPLKPSK